jgi:Holliday junction resolvase
MSNTGTPFEYAVRDYFVAMGFSVMRSAGSHGAADLVCWNKAQVYLIQCKKTSKRQKFTKDVEALRIFKAPNSWRKLLWVKVDRTVEVFEIKEKSLDMLTWFDVSEFNKLRKGGSKSQ